MDTQHTPGSWQVESDGTTVTMNGECVIVSPAPDSRPQDAKANARLIAAAPELLGACLSALRAIEDNLDPVPMDDDAKSALRMAIKKASEE